jgi:hypothetical protein
MTELTDLGALQGVVQKVDRAVRESDEALKRDIAANAEAKKHRSFIDELEEKVMAQTAIAAAASGTPEQAQEMLSKARQKAMQAAADGADTGTLDAMVIQMQHLTKIAEENRERERHGGQDRSAEAVPFVAAVGAR